GVEFVNRFESFYQGLSDPFHSSPTSFEFEEILFGFREYLYRASWLIATRGSGSCASCKNSLSTLKRAARFSFLRPVIIQAAYEVCRIRGIPREVCKGALKLYAPWFLEVLQEVDLNSKKDKYLPQLLCFSLDNTCDYPEEIVPAKLIFPPRQPVPKIINGLPGSRHLRILQLSDIHVDYGYTPGSEADCGLPICCQLSSTHKDRKRSAGVWGDYNCDLAPSMLNSMLDYIQTLPPVDMVIFTGDIPAHDVWNQTLATSATVEASTFKRLQSVFSTTDVPVIPAIGNHESVPANNFSVGTAGLDIPLYSFLADVWKDWLPLESQRKLKELGVYTVKAFPGLKVISLNTNMCYILNFWLVSSLPRDGQDPDSILHWLIKELQDSEDKGEKVYIIGHIPPSHPDCFRYWSDQFHQIVNRYHHIISGQFYGHTHLDQFQLFYRSQAEKAKDNAIGVAYIGPSVTTFEHLNPGFRIYEVEPETFQIYDALTYFTDLGSVFKSGTRPVWQLEYSARKSFDIPLKDTEPLLPVWWHEVVSKIENDNATLQEYYQLMFKRARPNVICDKECHDLIICSLRASNSTEACDLTTPVTRHQSKFNLLYQ
ncbi:hypothetical protein L0F63_005459, partial [Massospora cicadina]